MVVFFMVRAIPGDPAQIMLGQQATQEQVQQVRESMGLDKPILVQYGLFLKNAVRGDLGDSTVTGRPVTTELLVRLPATFELTAFAMIIAVLVGVPVGVISAVKQYSLLDKTTSVLARSEEHTSELQSRQYLVCRLLLEKKTRRMDQSA